VFNEAIKVGEPGMKTNWASTLFLAKNFLSWAAQSVSTTELIDAWPITTLARLCAHSGVGNSPKKMMTKIKLFDWMFIGFKRSLSLFG
jgi:hypothetical protein